MKDSMIITHADVYTEEMPSTSDSVMMSGDSPPPLQASMPSTGFDMPDEARPGKITPPSPSPITMKPLTPDSDAEMIEEATPIVQKTLPSPEPRPKIEMNGYDVDGAIKLPANVAKKHSRAEDDSCVVNCVYFAQQCCECAIL